MDSIWNDDQLTISLNGKIDSGNAADTEKELNRILGEGNPSKVLIDAGGLEYISSAGLRVILRLRKKFNDLTITNVRSEVYEIFEMTGFTEMINVRKAYKTISLEGAEEIGHGSNGILYRIDSDNVVKVYKNPDALDEIQHEREVAKLALILGIPTAISYDVVKVGDKYGSVFEFLNARSFAKIISSEPDKLDWCVGEYVEMLKLIHGTLVPEGKLPDMREIAVSWAEFLQDHLPEEPAKKLLSMVKAVPHDDHMIHGDYHTQNLVLQNDEVLLIDMDTLAVGDPIFELGSIYNAFAGFSELDHSIVKKFQGFDRTISLEFWHKFLAGYLDTEDEAVIKSVEDKARIIGYTRLIRRSIRRGGLGNAETKAEIEHWTQELLELLENYDTLKIEIDAGSNDPWKEINLEAKRENLDEVLSFIDGSLEAADCPMKTQMQIDIAVEELFVNVANYAYYPDTGRITIRIEIADDPLRAAITFIDQGIPYDPLAKEDPDITLQASERPIGGLGIFMVKKSMNDVVYEYKDGSNVLTIVKNF